MKDLDVVRDTLMCIEAVCEGWNGRNEPFPRADVVFDALMSGGRCPLVSEWAEIVAKYVDSDENDGHWLDVVIRGLNKKGLTLLKAMRDDAFWRWVTETTEREGIRLTPSLVVLAYEKIGGSD